jgi:hypothetical protein
MLALADSTGASAVIACPALHVSKSTAMLKTPIEPFRKSAGR